MMEYDRTAYDYHEAVKGDILNYLDENEIDVKERDIIELCELICDEDSITGNASGSYFCNRDDARRALLWNEDLYYSCASEFYTDDEIAEKFLYDPEAADVILRWSLVQQALFEIKEEAENEGV